MKRLFTILIILALPTASLANIDEIWTCYDKNIHVVVLQPTMSPNYKDKDRISSEDVFTMLAGIHRKYPELKILVTINFSNGYFLSNAINYGIFSIRAANYDLLAYNFYSWGNNRHSSKIHTLDFGKEVGLMITYIMEDNRIDLKVVKQLILYGENHLDSIKMFRQQVDSIYKFQSRCPSFSFIDPYEIFKKNFVAPVRPYNCDSIAYRRWRSFVNIQILYDLASHNLIQKSSLTNFKNLLNRGSIYRYYLPVFRGQNRRR